MITVIAAMEQELTGLRQALAGRQVGPVDLRVVGIGKEEAQSNVSRLLDSRNWSPADRILMLGFAGGLDPSLKPGDLVMPNYFFEKGGDVIAADPEMWQQSRAAAVDSGMRLMQGNSLTVDEIVSTVREKRSMYRDYQVCSVNLEDYWVAKQVADAGVPFLSVRAILDPADNALPKFVLGLSGHPFRAALRAVSRPGRGRRMLELARMRNQARDSLTQFGLAVISHQKAPKERRLIGVG